MLDDICFQYQLQANKQRRFAEKIQAHSSQFCSTCNVFTLAEVPHKLDIGVVKCFLSEGSLAKYFGTIRILDK